MRVYLREYWVHAVSVAISVVAVCTAVLWLRRTIRNGDDIEEPLLAVLAVTVTVFAAYRIRDRLAEVRNRLPPPPLETLEDTTLSPWRAINHSFPLIEWTPEVDRRTQEAILRVIGRLGMPTCQLVRHAGLVVVERLLEETLTDNFRVLSAWGDCFFVRIHKIPNEQQLEVRDRVAAYLARVGPFDSEFSRGLVPKHLGDCGTACHGTAVIFPPGELRDQKALLQVFSYVDSRSHFSGSSTQGLQSFARMFGQLQRAMDDAPPELGEEVRRAEDERRAEAKRLEESGQTPRPGAPEKSPDEVRDQLGRIMHWLEDTSSPEYRRFVDVIGSAEIGRAKSTIVAAANEAITRRQDFQDRRLSIHDMHPHNSFESDGKCCLIYDFAWAGWWNHDVVVAFALHRFVREVRRLDTAKDAAPRLRSAVNVFIDLYEKGWGKSLPHTFRSQLGPCIKCGNLEKLLNNVERVCRGDSDVRSTARIRGELRKFLRFMHEADEIAKAVSD